MQGRVPPRVPGCLPPCRTRAKMRTRTRASARASAHSRIRALPMPPRMPDPPSTAYAKTRATVRDRTCKDGCHRTCRDACHHARRVPRCVHRPCTAHARTHARMGATVHAMTPSTARARTHATIGEPRMPSSFRCACKLTSIVCAPCVPPSVNRACHCPCIARARTRATTHARTRARMHANVESHFLKFKLSPNVGYSQVLWAFCNVFQVHHQATKMGSYGIHLWFNAQNLKNENWQAAMQSKDLQHRTQNKVVVPPWVPISGGVP